MNFSPARIAAAVVSSALPIVAVAPLSACASGQQAAGGRIPLQAPPPTRASENQGTNAMTAGGTAASAVALLINGEPIGWETLRPLLAEASGGEVVEELALEHALRAELRARGVSIGEAQISSAREHWLALLDDSGVSVGAEAEIRARRGLGRERFRRLLWRNAALRALLDADDTSVSASEIGLARQIRTGRRYLVTGVIAGDTQGALAIAGAARTASGGAVAGLWQESSARDLVPFRASMSPFDPAYPESVRKVLASLSTGQPSSAIAVENGFGVVIVEAQLEPTGRPIDDAALRRELTIRKTRLAMERLARDLIDRTRVSKLDRSLP